MIFFLQVQFRSNIRDIGYKYNRLGDMSFFMDRQSKSSNDGERNICKYKIKAVQALLTIQLAKNTLTIEEKN